MKYIPLTRGSIAIVDDQDFDFLSQWQWYAVSDSDGRLYAVRDTHSDAGVIRMHRLLMNAPSEMLVDHADGITLNNQKSNLRLCNDAQNAQNRTIQRKARGTSFRGTSGFKGVTKKSNKWLARITTGGKRDEIGRFETTREAAEAYDEAAVRLHGIFARTNKAMGLL